MSEGQTILFGRFATKKGLKFVHTWNYLPVIKDLAAVELESAVHDGVGDLDLSDTVGKYGRKMLCLSVCLVCISLFEICSAVL